MKKIILCVAVLVMLVGCGTKYDEAEIVNDDFANGYFVVIKKWGEGDKYKIVYAVDTNVEYFIYKTSHGIGITPLLNPDGSAQIYEGVEEE